MLFRIRGAPTFIKMLRRPNVTITQTDSGISISATGGGGGGGGGGIASVSADTTPILGGNLDVATFSIVSSSNRNISITPSGTGTTIISKVATPSAASDAANKSYVDAHSSRTDNPHGVTASQVGRDTAQWNADRIRGVAVSSTTPSNGQILVYNSATTQYAPQTVNATPTAFWGFRVSGNRLYADYGYGTGAMTIAANASNYASGDTVFAPFTDVAINASGRLIATF